MTTRLTCWTAAGAAVLALGGIGGGVAAGATTKPATTKAASSSILSAKLVVFTMKGQPSPGKHASGAFSGTLKNDKVSYKITFSGLSAKVTGALLQFGTPGKASTKSMSVPLTHISPVKGVLTLTKSEAAAVKSGKAWITLETKKDASGAIRGRIAA